MITHETRREAHEAIKPKKPAREKLILASLAEIKQGTAHDIAIKLFNDSKLPYPLRSFVQPRLTELRSKGLVEVVGKKKDAVTGRTVAVYKRVK